MEGVFSNLETFSNKTHKQTINRLTAQSILVGTFFSSIKKWYKISQPHLCELRYYLLLYFNFSRRNITITRIYSTIKPDWHSFMSHNEKCIHVVPTLQKRFCTKHFENELVNLKAKKLATKPNDIQSNLIALNWVTVKLIIEWGFSLCPVRNCFLLSSAAYNDV